MKSASERPTSTAGRHIRLQGAGRGLVRVAQGDLEPGAAGLGRELGGRAVRDTAAGYAHDLFPTRG